MAVVAWCCPATLPAGETILIEVEGFSDWGGWVVDQQSMDHMGSPCLMAHGLGRPVKDASTDVALDQPGKYRVWVRTRDWVGTWKTGETRPAMKAAGFPGRFQVWVNGEPLQVEFGTEKANWHWQNGGTVDIPGKKTTLGLHDLTGFNGRCDAIVLARDHGFVPPDDLDAMTSFRRRLLGTEKPVETGGEYDFVVVGGGIAGVCSAISAARAGAAVALIQDRPVLGGNNSSEVRVGLSGLIRQEPYENLGNLVDEIDPVGHWTLWDAKQSPDTARSKEVLEIIRKHPEKKIHNAGPPANYGDDKKLKAVKAEKNITLYLCTRVNDVVMEDRAIVAVIGQDIRTGKRIAVRGRTFADCTGDGNLGFLAGADFRQGRESKAETQEGLAPEKADDLTMGTSMQWYSRKTQAESTFPADLPWAVQFDEKTAVKTTRGDWNWETGADRDAVSEIERIRDYALRVIFGNWSVLKNHPNFSRGFRHRELAWIAYIGGKRESRRLLGDVILQQQDIVSARVFPDACVTTTWTIDLHYPRKAKCACDAFMSEARHLKIKPCPIPYRCLYSRNVDNLMMAGRNISVTHVALGTVRVQRTTGMMGEVLGMAAAICRKHSCTPRGVYERHLDELKAMMRTGVPEAE